MSDWGFSEKKNNYDDWPKTESGDIVPPAFLMHVSNVQLEADILINMLNAYGVPTVTQYPNNGEFGKVMLGTSGTGIDVFVPETMVEDARNIIAGDIEPDEEE